jgi:TnpA family transposase
MRKRRGTSSFALPMMMARLTAASLETIFHRTAMISKGTCSSAEYQRMITEKTTAARRSMRALMTGKSLTAALAPYATRARANAKRLRKK